MAGGTITIGQTVTGGGQKGVKEDVYTFTGNAQTTLLIILSGATATVKAGLWFGSSPTPGSGNGLMTCCGGVGKATWGRRTLDAGGPMCISVQDGKAPGAAEVQPYSLTLQPWHWFPDDFEDNPLWSLFPDQC